LEVQAELDNAAVEALAVIVTRQRQRTNEKSNNGKTESEPKRTISVGGAKTAKLSWQCARALPTIREKCGKAEHRLDLDRQPIEAEFG
jgi:hypothetical protein